jgi:GNAT superfamily N-acetyltransferase
MNAQLKAVVFAAWRGVAALGRPSKDANRRRLESRGEDLSRVVIREAAAGDIPALAQLHVTTWNDTYAPLGMRGPPVAIREQQWRQAFAKANGSWFCFVVENAKGQLVGFAKGNRSDNPEYAGELNKIYLLREYQGLGIGKKLVGHVVRRFLDEGITSMWLFGDARNPSSNVWRALGAVKTDDDPGNGNYGWRDLRRLAERCPIP